MGLVEQILEGNVYNRVSHTFEKVGGVPSASNSTQALNSAFILLRATTNRPATLRLYSDEASLYSDASRPINNFNVSESIGLISEISLTTAGTLTFTPPLIGTSADGGLVWWYLSGSTADTTVTVQAYPIAPNGLDIGSVLAISASAVTNASNGVSGSIVSPNGYLIISCSSATKDARLRLYSTPLSEIPTEEKLRNFDTVASASSNLIADLIFDDPFVQYKLVPVLEAYTWENKDFSTGTNVTSYILENKSVTSPINMTASLYIYSFED
jgi:hypothetical protein